MSLKKLGWNQDFNKKYNDINKENRFIPARVAVEYKNMYKLFTSPKTELLGEITGKLRYNNKFPAVGDWVLISPTKDQKAIIHHILPRKSKFSRNVAGKANQEQIIATNIDILFIVTSLNQDFNLRRIERYLTIAWNSGAQPVVLLSKADLCSEKNTKKREVENITHGVPVHVISALTGEGMSALDNHMKTGKTCALLGSSGVGKSTLINKLLGEEKFKTREIRADDDRGRHTTTHRELIVLQNKGIIIDNPGMREIQLWTENTKISGSFQDIKELAQNCHFNDCQHKSEPNCAVKLAIKDGKLSKKRLENYNKLKRELKYAELKKKKGSRAIEKYKYTELYNN